MYLKPQVLVFYEFGPKQIILEQTVQQGGTNGRKQMKHTHTYCLHELTYVL